MSSDVFFRLSNRQKKELYVRGQSLTIVVPVDRVQSWNPEATARRLLREVDETIQSVRATEITVILPAPSVEGLSSVLGRIVEDDRPRDGLRVTMLVLEVTLAHGEPRGKITRPQWPGEAMIDGQPLSPIKE